MAIEKEVVPLCQNLQNMQKELNYLDRNEFNFEPSEEVKNCIRNFDLGKFCFYTRIYDQGKKSIFSEYLSELYDIDEHQIVLGYGAEDLLKKAVHYFLTLGGSKTMLIPKYSVAGEPSDAFNANGRCLLLRNAIYVFPSSASKTCNLGSSNIFSCCPSFSQVPGIRKQN